MHLGHCFCFRPRFRISDLAISKHLHADARRSSVDLVGSRPGIELVPRFQIETRGGSLRCYDRSIALIPKSLKLLARHVDEDRHYSFAVPPMMPQAATRSNPQICDGLGSCAAIHGRRFSNFARTTVFA